MVLLSGAHGLLREGVVVVDDPKLHSRSLPEEVGVGVPPVGIVNPVVKGKHAMAERLCHLRGYGHGKGIGVRNSARGKAPAGNHIILLEFAGIDKSRWQPGETDGWDRKPETGGEATTDPFTNQGAEVGLLDFDEIGLAV
jgi:hypothetical protein